MSKPVCEIHLHRNFGFMFRRVRGKSMAIDQATKELLACSCIGGVARARRVVERVLSHFPWTSASEDVWCGVHPLLDASLQNITAKVWSLRVAPAHAPEVLRTLMPIARQLGVSVAVPYFNFFVDAAQAIAEREVYPERAVAKYDPRWNEALDVPAAKKKLYEGLTTLFAPLGFVPQEGSTDLFSLKRPLDGGRSYQRVFVSQGNGVEFEVCSGLLRDTKAKVYEDPDFKLTSSPAARTQLSSLREQSDKFWGGDGADSCWATDELVQLALDDARRLIVPLVDLWTSARGIYDWYFDPAWVVFNPWSYSDWSGLMQDNSRRAFTYLMNESPFLVARLLPDASYVALLSDWEKKLCADTPLSFGATRCLKFVAFYRQMPPLSEAAI